MSSQVREITARNQWHLGCVVLGMFAIPQVGGAECAAVLERLGWHRDREARGMARLSRGHRVVYVPEATTLGPAVLDAILLATSTDPLDFLHMLATLKPAA